MMPTLLTFFRLEFQKQLQIIFSLNFPVHPNANFWKNLMNILHIPVNINLILFVKNLDQKSRKILFYMKKNL